GDAAPASVAAASVVTEHDSGESVDLLKVVALPVAKRFGPVAAGVAAGVAVGFLVGRRKRKAPPPASAELQALLARLLS
ncbi:MAG: uncharacterized protein QOE57_2345, partial [Acidimicrobiaceae bacterium]|nr:uncharacterized protein [Acidimicrobiaceae bacterium]